MDRIRGDVVLIFLFLFVGVFLFWCGFNIFFKLFLRCDLVRYIIVLKGVFYWVKCIFLKFLRGGIYWDYSIGIRVVVFFLNCL